MTLTKTKVVAEIAGLLVLLVVVQWLTTVLLHTRAFWPLMVSSALYIGVRAVMLANRTRPGAQGQAHAGTTNPK